MVSFSKDEILPVLNNSAMFLIWIFKTFTVAIIRIKSDFQPHTTWKFVILFSMHKWADNHVLNLHSKKKSSGLNRYDWKTRREENTGKRIKISDKKENGSYFRMIVYWEKNYEELK